MKVVKKYILNEINAKGSLQWIYNIFDKKSESEKILYEDLDEKNGFILVPDYAFDGKNKEELHLIALSRVKDIYCIRELNSNYLTLLKNIYSIGVNLLTNDFYILVLDPSNIVKISIV